MLKSEEAKIDKTTMRKIKQYNLWAKEQRKKLEIWRPKPANTDSKKPFKKNDAFFADSDEAIENNPEILEMYEKGNKETPIDF